MPQCRNLSDMYYREASDQPGACFLKHLLLFSKVCLNFSAWSQLNLPESEFKGHTPCEQLLAFSFFTPVENNSGLSSEFVFVWRLNVDLCLVIRGIILVFWSSLKETTLEGRGGGQGSWAVTNQNRDYKCSPEEHQTNHSLQYVGKGGTVQGEFECQSVLVLTFQSRNTSRARIRTPARTASSMIHQGTSVCGATVRSGDTVKITWNHKQKQK